MEQNILGRINKIKHNVQNIWEKYSDQDFQLAREKIQNVTEVVKDKFHKLTEGDEEVHPINIDNYHYESHHPDDHLGDDEDVGVTFYDTENSPLAAKGAKSIPRGIDKFSDEDDEVLEEDIKRPKARKKVVRKKKTIH